MTRAVRCFVFVRERRVLLAPRPQPLLRALCWRSLLQDIASRGRPTVILADMLCVCNAALRFAFFGVIAGNGRRRGWMNPGRYTACAFLRAVFGQRRFGREWMRLRKVSI